MENEKSALPSGVRSLVKNLNRSVVLDLLRRDGPLSRTEIAERTGISLPVVSRLTQKLIAEKRVLEVGKADSSGGRRRTLLGYNYAFGKVIGVDMGATKTAIGLTDLSGSILFHRRVSTASFYARGKLIESLARGVEDLIRDAGVDADELVGVGVGVPGIVRDGHILEAPGLNLTDDERAIERVLSQRLGLPVWVDNDANATVLGEHWKGELQGVQHAMCVAIGTGIGVGILAGGQLYRGAHGAAGEIGYWIFENAPDLVKDSHRYGFLESVAAGPGIQRRALAAAKACPDSLLARIVASRVQMRDIIETGQGSTRTVAATGVCELPGDSGLCDGPGLRGDSGLRDGPGFRDDAGFRDTSGLRDDLRLRPGVTLPATDVFAAAEQGDPVALEVVRETTDVLGVALGNAAALLDPEVIVITGGVARAGNLLLAPIAETVARIAPYPPRVVLSSLHEEATILGAVWGVLRKNESLLKINVQ